MSLRSRSILMAGTAFVLASTQIAAAQTANGGLETVVVTAQKRAENVRNVPISITAVSGQSLVDGGVVSFHDLARIAPNFQSIEEGDSRTSTMTMRGVTSQQNDVGQQSSIGVFLDGVFLARTGMGSSQDFLDIDRIEVLRGPQGTLFGMNTAAGLINIITRKPNLDNFEGEVSATYGSYNTLQLRGMVTGPIINDELGFSLSAYSDSHAGYTYDPVTHRHVDNQRKYGVRGKLEFKSGNFDGTISADYNHESSECCSAIIAKLLPGANLLGVPIAPLAPAGYPFSRETVQGTRNINPNEGGGITADLNWTFGDFTLTSLTSARYWNASPVSDIDSLPLDVLDNFVIKQRHKQFSEELRITSPSDSRLEYVAGLFYYYRNSSDYENLALGSAVPAFFIVPGTDGATVIDGTVNDRSYAAFAHVDYHWTDALTTSAGIRYSVEPQHVRFAQTSNNFAFPGLGSTHQKRRDEALTWTLDANYKWSDDVSTYVSAARGFKPGGFDMTRLNSFTGFQFRPETNVNYEVGLKSGFFDNRVSLNVSAFYTDYKNFQTLAFDGLNLVTTNAGKFTTRGFELEAAARPIDGLTLTAATGYVDAHYVDFPNGQCPSGVTGSCNLNGKPLDQTPRWTFNASAQYDWSVGSGMDAFARLDASFRSKVFYQQSLDPNAVQNGYGLLNARIGINYADGWETDLFANNLTKTKYLNFIYPSPLASGVYVGYVGAPRIYGIRLQKSF